MPPPLHLAANVLDVPTVEEILNSCSESSQVKILDEDGENVLVPLGLARHETPVSGDTCEHTQILDLLHDKLGEEFESLVEGLSDGQTLAHLAARSTCLAFLARVKNDGEKLDTADVNSRTPLWFATLLGGADSVRLLLENGCDPWHRDNKEQIIMHVACESLNCDKVQAIVDCCEDSAKMLTAQMEDGSYPLHRMARMNCRAKIEGGPESLCQHVSIIRLLKKRLPKQFRTILEKKTRTGWTIAHFAALGACQHLLRLLKSEGVALDEPNDRGNTPLALATLLAMPMSVRFLLENGCDPWKADKKGQLALHLACESLNCDTVKAVLEGSKDSADRMLLAETFDGWNILQRVAVSDCDKSGDESSSLSESCKHLQLLQYLQDKMGDKFATVLNKKTAEGRSAAHFAAASDCIRLLQFLREQGLSLIEKDLFGRIPLYDAFHHNKIAAAKFLLKEDWNLNDKDSWGKSALHSACTTLNVEILKLVLKKTASPQRALMTTDFERKTIVHILSQRDCSQKSKDNQDTCEHIEMLEFIKKTIADSNKFKYLLNMKTHIGCTTVQLAASSDCKILLKFLEDEGCEIDTPDNDGDTPLGEAAGEGSTKAMEFLLDRQCDIEYRSKNGETPFLQACRGGSFHAAKLLHQHKAKVDTKDDQNNTALHLLAAAKDTSRFPEFFKWAHKRMKKRGVEDPLMQENLSQQMFLHTLADSGHLLKLTRIPHVKPIHYHNSDGLNVVHVVAGKHSLQDLERQWADKDTLKSLMCDTVKRGHYKDFNCLHFACQTGMVDNINYLIENFPELMTVAPGCQSPMQILIKHNHNRLLLKRRINANPVELAKAIDTVETSLRLPTDEEAQQILLPLCDPELKGIVMKKQLDREETYMSGRAMNAGEGEVHYRASVKLFYLAMKEDSNELFRCIVKLGFWRTLNTEEAAVELFEYLRHMAEEVKDREENDDSDESEEEDEEENYNCGRSWLSAWCCTVRASKGQKRSARIRHALPVLHHAFQSVLNRPISDTTSYQECFDLTSLSLLGIAVKTGRFSIAKDLVVMEQFHLIPTCLVVIDECRRLEASTASAQQPAEDLRRFCTNVLLNAMDELDKTANERELPLLHAYMAGRFSPDQPDKVDQEGPKFKRLTGKKERSVIDMATRNWSYETLASDCITRFVKNEWKQSPRSEAGCFATSPQMKYWLHFVSFLVFMGLFTYFVCTLESGVTWIDYVMYAFAVSFAVQEVIDFFVTVKQSSRQKFSRQGRFWKFLLKVWRYFGDVWNWFDIVGIILLITGLSWKLNSVVEDLSTNHQSVVTSQKFYSIRMLLAVSYMVWCLRSLYFLRSFDFLGPFVSMLKTLLQRDLVPFLAMFGVFSLAFGVLFFNLLLPDSRQYDTSGRVGARDVNNFYSLYTRPLLLAFGHLEIEDLLDCSNASASWSDQQDNNVTGTCTHPVGTFFYFKLVIFLFLFLVNLTLLNMLIAKFSLTVSSKEDKAYMIWRRYEVQILRDYQVAVILPPPLTLLALPYMLFMLVSEIHCNNEVDVRKSKWYQAKKRQQQEFQQQRWRKKELQQQQKLLDQELQQQKYKQQDFQQQEMLQDELQQKNLLELELEQQEAQQQEKQEIPTDLYRVVTATRQGFRSRCVSSSRSKSPNFAQFLLFQAVTFMDKRNRFFRHRVDHGPMIEQLKVDVMKLQDTVEDIRRSGRNDVEERLLPMIDDLMVSVKAFK